MSTLENRPSTALLVVDVQNGVVAEAHERDAVVANVASLVETARREHVPVVWVQHSDENLERGSEKWRIVPELTPGAAEPLVEKSYGDAFVRGYDVTLVSDAHTTEDSTEWGAPPPDQIIAFTNLYWQYEDAPGRTAGTVETKDVDFSGSH
jgi:nicotinamidase-related amidase